MQSKYLHIFLHIISKATIKKKNFGTADLLLLLRFLDILMSARLDIRNHKGSDTVSYDFI